MSATHPTATDWPKLEAAFADASALPVGMILLGTDRVSEPDVQRFLPDDGAVEVFATRVPMSLFVSPETLAAMETHLADAARVLVPGGPLRAIGFSCTSGTVAIGSAAVAARIGEGRPGVPVTNPVDAGIKGLRTLGARRIALLTPYLDGPSGLIQRAFRAAGLEVVAKASFKLDGDAEMNRVSPEVLIAAGKELGGHPEADALFISCTGLRTRDVIEPLEAALAKPVVTSNQALAWDLARTAGYAAPLEGRGRLFTR